jgi:predicted PurR-regulated permease PerM
MTDERATRRLILWTIAMSLSGIVLLWLLYLLRDVLLIVYLSAVLAFGFSPMVHWIERRPSLARQKRPLPRWLAILALYVMVLGVLATMLAIVLPPFVSQARDLWAHLPVYVERGQRWLVSHRLIAHPLTPMELVASSPDPDVALTHLIGAAETLIGGVFGFSTILLLSYYMLVEARDMQTGLLHFIQPGRRAQVSRVVGAVTTKVGAWLNGQIVVALISGTSAAIALWLIGVRYFYVLALICGVGELVPVAGPILAAVPAMAVASSLGLQPVVLVATYVALQQFIQNHFVIPKVMQRRVGVSAMTVVVALLVGASLFGVIGALLAVPTAAIVQILVREYLAGRLDA